MKIISTIIFCFLFAIYSKGQNDQEVVAEAFRKDTPFLHYCGKEPLPRTQAVYMEFFGSSANLYSWNYEKCFFMHKGSSKKWDRYSLRMGLNYFMKRCAVPVMFHYSRGIDYCFEAGAGWVPWISSEKRVDGVAVFSGFRYQPGRTGLMARFALTPTYLIQEKEHWHMIFGFSFGWAFY